MKLKESYIMFSKLFLDAFILDKEIFEEFRDHLLFYEKQWESASRKKRHRMIRQLSNLLRDNFPDFYLKVFSDKFFTAKQAAKKRKEKYEPSVEHLNLLQVPLYFIFQYPKIFLLDTIESRLELKRFMIYLKLVIHVTPEENRLLRKFSESDGSGLWKLDPIERINYLIDNNKILLRNEKSILTENPVSYYNEEYKIFCQKRKVL